MLKRLLFAALLLAPVAGHADEFDGVPTLSTDDKAAIDAEKAEAKKQIDEKYKDDDSSEARRAKQDAINEADQKVLEKHGVNQKDYLWQNSHNSPDDKKAISAKSTELQKKHEAEAKKAKEPKAATQPEVIRGFDEAHPPEGPGAAGAKPKVDADGNPVVEDGLPPGVQPAPGSDAPMPTHRPSRHHRSRHHRGE